MVFEKVSNVWLIEKMTLLLPSLAIQQSESLHCRKASTYGVSNRTWAPPRSPHNMVHKGDSNFSFLPFPSEPISCVLSDPPRSCAISCKRWISGRISFLFLARYFLQWLSLSGDLDKNPIYPVDFCLHNQQFYNLIIQLRTKKVELAYVILCQLLSTLFFAHFG